jgi:hypothetical protein
MIKNIIDLLQVDEFYGVSKNVDTAKGLYQKPKSWKELKELAKRLYHGRKY